MRALLAASVVAWAAAAPAAAEPPAWADDACAGLDCSRVVAAVGQAVLLPDIRLSSAVAYAEAARVFSNGFDDYLSVGEKAYGEGDGDALDSAVKDLSRSPLGSSLTKTYGDADADTISVAVKLRPLDEAGLRVYSQEYIDPYGQTLYVRLAVSRDAARRGADGSAPEAGLGAGWAPWRGGRIRLASEDVRVGRRNEFTLWAEDDDADVAWVEHWPSGGGDLLRHGEVAGRYIYDKRIDRWKPAPASRTASDER